MVQRVTDGGARVGQPFDRLARVDHAGADRQILAEEVLAVEHDARGGVGVDGDDVLVEGAAPSGGSGADRAHFLSPSPLRLMWPAGRKIPWRQFGPQDLFPKAFARISRAHKGLRTRYRIGGVQRILLEMDYVVQPTQEGFPGGTYRSNRGLSLAIIILLSFHAALSLVLAFSWPSIGHLLDGGEVDGLGGAVSAI